jgi:general secretion pathway protein J
LHRNRVNRSKGYTIIEVLISVAIFSAVVTLATMALNQGLKQYNRLMDTGINFWEHAKYLWLNRCFQSMVDYYVTARTGADQFPYFVGTQDYISFVTLSPFAYDLPVAVWIVKEQLSEGGTVLVYYELPAQALGLDELERIYTFSDYRNGQSTVLIDNIIDLEILYRGYNRLEDRWEWVQDYRGRESGSLPEMVQISFRDSVTEERKRFVFGISTNSLQKGASGV